MPEEALQMLATSWGLTQIMGYHVLRDGQDPRWLLIGANNLVKAVAMLKDFAATFQLSLPEEMDELFRCWNTGKPYGVTYDPEYCERGKLRAALYRDLVAGRTA
jgi:hypothetical protein